jgi:hypothetical protein
VSGVKVQGQLQIMGTELIDCSKPKRPYIGRRGVKIGILAKTAESPTIAR